MSHLQVLVTVALQGAGLLQVTSDLSKVLYFSLQRLNLKEQGGERVSVSASRKTETTGLSYTLYKHT